MNVQHANPLNHSQRQRQHSATANNLKPKGRRQLASTKEEEEKTPRHQSFRQEGNQTSHLEEMLPQNIERAITTPQHKQKKHIGQKSIQTCPCPVQTAAEKSEIAKKW
jgi:hypothetical protein